MGRGSTTRTRPPVQRTDAGPPGLPSGDAGGGGGEDWTLLTTAPNSIVAHLILGRLAAQEIEAVLDTSNPAPGAWLLPFGDQQAPVRVFVRRRDLAGAALVLHEVDHRPPDPNASGPSSVRLMVWAVVAIALLLAGLEIIDFAPCVLRIVCF